MKDDRRYMSFETRAIDDPRYRGKIAPVKITRLGAVECPRCKRREACDVEGTVSALCPRCRRLDR